MNAFHVEAKLHGFRRTQEGVVVSFVVSPIDMPKELALDPLGTRYMLALAAIGDDEQPLSQTRREVVPHTDTHGDLPQEEPPTRRRADNATPSSFEAGASAASQRGKEHYASLPPQQQAVVRAARLPRDERFQDWVFQKLGTPVLRDLGEDTAIHYIQTHCCGGGSRAGIAQQSAFYERFLKMETSYLMDVGVIPEPR